MSRQVSEYDGDRRVRRRGKGFTVTTAGREFRVLPTGVFGWSVFTGPNLDLVHDGRGNPVHGYRTADQAIRAVIGAPR